MISLLQVLCLLAPAIGIIQAAIKRNSNHGCCFKIEISEKLDDGEEALADPRFLQTYRIAVNDVNGRDHYMSTDNNLALWYVSTYKNKGHYIVNR